MFGLTTSISAGPTWAPAGVVKSISVAETTVYPVSGDPANDTVALGSKPVPLRTTMVPPAIGPAGGETVVIVGAGRHDWPQVPSVHRHSYEVTRFTHWPVPHGDGVPQASGMIWQFAPEVPGGQVHRIEPVESSQIPEPQLVAVH